MKESTKEKLMWIRGDLSEEEIVQLRIDYANHKSPKKIYDEKYKDRMHYNSFLNIWSGRRYKNILSELLEIGRHTKMTKEKVSQIREKREKFNTSYSQLAEEFGVSKSTIAGIITKKNLEVIKSNLYRLFSLPFGRGSKP